MKENIINTEEMRIMFTATKGIYEGQGYEIVTMAGAGHEIRILPVNGFTL